MAVLHAAREQYELCELDGKPVAFTNMRLDRQTIPDGLYCYDIRDSDNLDGSCAEDDDTQDNSLDPVPLDYQPL